MALRNWTKLGWLVVACSCGGSSGGQGAPGVDSFVASAPSVAAGVPVQLTATFHGGAGTIDQGVGAVVSGTPVTVRPSASTTYTLKVAGSGSALATRSVSVLVSGSSCIGKPLLQSLGKTRILTGAQMADTTATATAWDGRYIYLAGGIFDQSAPCASCATNCTASGHSCANSAGGCAWWGCYQSDQVPPGKYVRDFVAAAKGRGQIPWFTYYELLQTSGISGNETQVVASINNAAILTRYLGDLKFLFQQIGTETAFVHVEPDFWGYGEHTNPDPHAIPAAVTAAMPSDCGTQENSLAGFGRCIIALARKYAPNARVGFHASGFSTGVDVSLNTNPGLDVAAEAKKTAAFLAAAGATQADFVATDASDRDAGYYQSIGRQTFWDPNNATLPDFRQELTWVQSLSEALLMPVFFWQVPVGNMSLPNTTDHWKDNRVDYFYTRAGELAVAHVAGMMFGGGATGMTVPETDGGNLINREKAWVAPGGGQILCP